jgi:Protein of unknown function (DUF642)
MKGSYRRGEIYMKSRSALAIAALLSTAILIPALTLASTSSSLAQSARTPRATVNLVGNGSFEKPVVANPCPNGGSTNPTAGICTYFGGSTGVTDWTVGGNSIDLISAKTTGSAAAQGGQWVDLSGDAPGSLTQSVTTVAGDKYTLTWYLGGGEGAHPTCGQATKVMNVYWDGVLMANPTSTKTLPLWVKSQVTVLAIGPRSTIEFADATPDMSECGAHLDAVSLDQAQSS